MTSGRGWVVVLAGVVALTVAATVAYLAAPFDPPPAARAGPGGLGTVPPAHRIAAVTTDGSLVLLDARDGELGEVVVAEPMPPVVGLELGGHRETAYVVRGGGSASIDVVRLRTGTHERRATGRAATVGPLAFPQLARTTPRPEVELLAHVVDGEDGDEVVVENLTTGERRRIGRGGFPFDEIDDLVLSPTGNRLFGVADGGTFLFRLDLDRMERLGQAATAAVPGARRVVDATPWGDGLAVILAGPDGRTELVAVDRRTLDTTEALLGPWPDPLRHVDADRAASRLLLVTAAGDLLVVAPADSAVPEVLAEDVRLAAW